MILKRIFGTLLKIIGAIIAFTGAIALYSLKDNKDFTILQKFKYGVLWVIVLSIGMYLFSEGRKWIFAEKNKRFTLATGDKVILFLRNFGQDKLNEDLKPLSDLSSLNVLEGAKTWEELFLIPFESHGNVVGLQTLDTAHLQAIGAYKLSIDALDMPGELGTEETKLKWQEVIMERLLDARLVLMYFADTQGVGWEVDAITHPDHLSILNKTLFYFNTPSDYLAFCTRYGHRIAHPLPAWDAAKGSGFLLFNDTRPQFSEFDSSVFDFDKKNNTPLAIHNIISPKLEELGLPSKYKAAPLNTRLKATLIDIGISLSLGAATALYLVSSGSDYIEIVGTLLGFSLLFYQFTALLAPGRLMMKLKIVNRALYECLPSQKKIRRLLKVFLSFALFAAGIFYTGEKISKPVGALIALLVLSGLVACFLFIDRVVTTVVAQEVKEK